jgi:isopenicillin N synthase-like dioxygenase
VAGDARLSRMLDYFNQLWRLGRDLHRGFALDLGLDPDFFESKLDRPNATLRLLHYPPSEKPLSGGQLGAGVHTDYGNVALLATDAVGGLMVQDRSGRWLDAPVIPGTFVCNIGDCLMRWSNDVYVSTPHKVVKSGPRSLLGRLFPRSQSGRGGRLSADLYQPGTAGEIRADIGR